MTSAEDQTPEAMRPERELAECWADFTKALSIYPPTNVRVQERLEGIADAHRRALEKAEDVELPPQNYGVAILFRNGMLILGDDEIEIPSGSSLEWLQARLDRASLAGIEFMPGMDEEPLIAFTQQLLAIYLRRRGATDFESLWPERYPGLVLIDRRFEGRFGASGEDAPYRGGHAGLGGSGEGQRSVVEVLVEDKEVSGSLARLEQRSTAGPTEGRKTMRAVELIDRIVQFMPADAMKDRKTLLAAVREVLQALEERLVAEQEPGPLSEMNNDMTLSTLLYSVSRSHFARVGPAETEWAIEEALTEAGDGKRKSGHAGDEKIDEDVDAFLEEWAALPADLAVDLSLSHAEVKGEEAAVLLHYLVRAGSKVLLEGLYPTLDRVLEDPGAEVLDVLQQYLKGGADEESGDEDDTAARSTPLLEFLRRTDRTSLLRECGVFTVDWVAAAFPHYFVLYLESLNMQRAADAKDLNAVCEKIGRERMLRAMGPLQTEGSKMDPATARDLLLEPHVSRIALARLLTEWHGGEITRELATFLRKLDLDLEEAFLVRRAIDLRFFTAEYLRGVLDLYLGRTSAARLRPQIADVLCGHVRGTRKSEPSSNARIASIESLVDYPSSSSEQLLRELGRWSLFALGKSEPAFVRRLARSLRKRSRAA